MIEALYVTGFVVMAGFLLHVQLLDDVTLPPVETEGAFVAILFFSAIWPVTAVALLFMIAEGRGRK